MNTMETKKVSKFSFCPSCGGDNVAMRNLFVVRFVVCLDADCRLNGPLDDSNGSMWNKMYRPRPDTHEVDDILATDLKYWHHKYRSQRDGSCENYVNRERIIDELIKVFDSQPFRKLIDNDQCLVQLGKLTRWYMRLVSAM